MRSDSSKSIQYKIGRLITSPKFYLVTGSVIALAIGVSLYTRLRPDHITVNPNDKKTPQFAYREDEFALLQVTLANLMDMETKKEYPRIYNEMTSHHFKKNVPLRVFLKITNCAEQYLGDVISYDRFNLGFHRQVVKGKELDTIRLQVERSEASIEETFSFEKEGLVDFKLSKIHWITDRKVFHTCMREASRHLPLSAPKNGEPLDAAESGTETPKTDVGGMTPVETNTATPTPQAAPVPAAAPTPDTTEPTAETPANDIGPVATPPDNL